MKFFIVVNSLNKLTRVFAQASLFSLFASQGQTHTSSYVESIDDNQNIFHIMFKKQFLLLSAYLINVPEFLPQQAFLANLLTRYKTFSSYIKSIDDILKIL
jgi:hypothetical protein